MDTNERETSKWRPSRVIGSSGDAVIDRERARGGTHVVWYGDDQYVVTLGYCEHDPDRDIHKVFTLAESRATALVEEVIKRGEIDRLPIGCARDQLEERSRYGGRVDGDFYWNGKSFLFLRVPAILTEAKGDDAWHLALQLTREAKWDQVLYLFAE
jgi:hypothetical protein